MTASETDILRFRLASQLIAPSSSGGVADVVRHFLAMQAQDLGQAVWALGSRVPGSTRDDVLAAFERREIVRTWPMRGTLHFVDPSDARWMLRLTAARVIGGLAARHRELGLDDAVFRRAADVAVSGLGGGRSLGRSAFTALLEDAGISMAGQRGPHVIGYLAQTALLCWGPPEGTQQALVLFDEWAPETHVPDRDEALCAIVLRYFTGHGPATLADFTGWSKLTVADSKRGLELARHSLVEAVHADTSYWMARAAADAASARLTATVQALPGFDEYLIGYQNRSHSLDIEFAPRIVPGGNGVFLPLIVSHGRIVGTWRRAVGAAGVSVTALPFEPMDSRDTAGFERAAARYARFLGLPLELRWG